MDSTKSKKRKISEVFGPTPTKITRSQSRRKTGAKDVSSVNQGTQTDGAFEINSMKKEGLKFLVSRLSSHEAKRATGNFKMCSIADEHFFLKTEGTEEWEIEKKFVDADCPELDYLLQKAFDFLNTILVKDKSIWHISNYELKLEEVRIPAENSNSTDKMTQYGEDSPDEDFFEG